jgi:calcineurin-like phosphoesterase
LKLLFVGDIVGRPGRYALTHALGRLVDRHCVDLVIANGENAAAGFGLTAEVAQPGQ